MKGNKNNLYDWVFNYNPYTDKWRAAKRDNYTDLFSKSLEDTVLSSSRIETLVELITKTDGDRVKIEALLG